MLNAIDSEIFPIPYECRESPRIPPADPALKVVVAEPLMKFHLLPVAKMGVDSSVQLASVDIKAQQQLAFEIPQLQASIEQLRQMRPSLVNRQTTDDGEIVFLGTGSALPSKYRNVSGICITVPPLPGGDAKYVIMDCGEGTLGQLYRLFGPNIKTFLQNLVCIQISHLHADHHLGLLRLLHARQQLEGAEGWNPVVVVGPGPLNKWLMDYSSLESLPFTFINCAHLIPTSRHFASTSRTLSHIGVKSISACSVVHCPLAFGLSLEHDSGWKVTYSGDTRPCQSLVDLGRNSTVLIHEATFDDDLRAEAVMKKHSTTAEAIDVGNRMNAQFTILTHFSQRYPKIPVFDDCTNHTTGVAFDFMRVHMRNLPVLSHLVPPLKLLFADEIFAREAGEEA
jgi:ribonuclease Z